MVGQEGGSGSDVVHLERLVDGAGKFDVRAVHAPIMPLTHGTSVMLIKLQTGP
jgi:hypothetical protein